MVSRQTRQKFKRRQRKYLLNEREYFREIRKLYRQWLNDWLVKIGQAIGMKLDAPSDWLGPLFANMASDFAVRVKRFSISIKKRANGISALATLQPSDDTIVDLSVNPWEFDMNVSNDIQDFVSENVALITNIGNQTTQRMQTLVVDALKNGTTPNKLKKQIMQVDRVFGKNRARLIARDQMGKLQSQITRGRAERAGVEKYEWMTAGDHRVRSKHKALDGEERTWKQEPTPGSEIQCRCVAIPLI
jgi:SPP1 gp7 family putative phage head morphogenesis protein